MATEFVAQDGVLFEVVEEAGKEKKTILVWFPHTLKTGHLFAQWKGGKGWVENVSGFKHFTV